MLSNYDKFKFLQEYTNVAFAVCKYVYEANNSLEIFYTIDNIENLTFDNLHKICEFDNKYELDLDRVKIIPYEDIVNKNIRDIISDDEVYSNIIIIKFDRSTDNGKKLIHYEDCRYNETTNEEYRIESLMCPTCNYVSEYDNFEDYNEKKYNFCPMCGQKLNRKED